MTGDQVRFDAVCESIDRIAVGGTARRDPTSSSASWLVGERALGFVLVQHGADSESTVLVTEAVGSAPPKKSLLSLTTNVPALLEIAHDLFGSGNV